MTAPLRFLTYLAPSLPAELFRLVGERIGRVLDVPVTVAVDMTKSGPRFDEVDPFTTGRADVGFVCAPSYAWLQARTPPPVELIEATFVFDDERAGRAPVYFSDVIVAASSPLTSGDLLNATWAYNDDTSLSGYYSLPDRLRERRPELLLRSGSHVESIALVAAGEVDAAAIDSNALALALRAENPPAVRVVDTWGPYPIQPIVARAGLGDATRAGIAAALLSWDTAPELGRFGVAGFAAVAPAHYLEDSVPGARPKFRRDPH